MARSMPVPFRNVSDNTHFVVICNISARKSDFSGNYLNGCS
jgi:hypothetical protein